MINRMGMLPLFLVLVLVPVASANMAVNPNGPVGRTILPFILSETLFLAVILIPVGFRFLPMILGWLVVTTVTWIGFGSLFAYGAPAAARISEMIGFYVVLLGFVIVVVIEAFVLRSLSSKRLFREDYDKPLDFLMALTYSTMANVVSIIGGLALKEMF